MHHMYFLTQQKPLSAFNEGRPIIDDYQFWRPKTETSWNGTTALDTIGKKIQMIAYLQHIRMQ